MPSDDLTGLFDLLGGLDPDEIRAVVDELPPGVVSALTKELRSSDDTQLPADPLAQAQEIDARFASRPHLDYLASRVAAAVRDVEGGQNRMLAVSMPPRSGKSTLLSVYTPLWLLRLHPEWKIVLASHDDDLITGWARQVRRLIEEHPHLGIDLSRDSGSGSRWRTVTGGGMFATSVRGPLTGRGGTCVVGDTHIDCEYGTITAANAFQRGITRIRAYDHTAGRPVWRDVEAAQRTTGRRVLTVITTGGRTLTCTPDHLVYTSRGHVPAGSLRGGETLLAVVGADRMRLRQFAGDAEDGCAEGDPPRPEPLLLSGMSAGRGSGNAADPVVPRMRRPVPGPWFDESLLLRRLPGARARTAPDLPRVPRVCSDVPSKEFSKGLLLPPLRECCALAQDDWPGELALQDGNELCPLFSNDAAPDFGTRRQQMCGLRRIAQDDLPAQGSGRREVRLSRASRGRGCHEQPSAQSHYALQDVPRNPSQVGCDTVASVSAVGEGPVDVYDFQVAGTRNFFGNGVLVHNCLILDDPVKDFVEAHSPTIRNSLWNWWLTVALTRLEPPYLVCVVMTRWHTDDMVGRLMSLEHEGDPGQWERISLPATAEADDVLSRAPGEPLLSPLLEETPDEALARWADIRQKVGSYAWAGMYQQRPAPAKGAIFDTGWWRFWTWNRANATEDGRVRYVDPGTLTGGRWLDSWDCAFGETTSAASSYVVGQRWVRSGPDRYLIAQQRDRWAFTATLDRMRAWANGGGPHGKHVHQRLIEKKANGAAVINVLGREIAGLKAIVPKESKEARARAVTPECESGNVLLPYLGDPGNEWVGDLLSELRNFPFDAHDDQVDALTQGLLELRDAGAGLVSVPGRSDRRVGGVSGGVDAARRLAR